MIRLSCSGGGRLAWPLDAASSSACPRRFMVRRAAIFLATFVLAGAATATDGRAAPKPTTPDRAQEGACAAAVEAGAVPRSLAEILDRVRQSPRAAAAVADNAAFDALTEQAGARPNPELGVEIEDFTGSGSYSAFGQTQTTFSVTQKIELGGLRARRVDVAASEGVAGKARGADETLKGEVAAKQRVVEWLASAGRRRIALDGERLAHAVLADAERRAGAGAGSVADTERARIAVAAAGLEVAAADRMSLAAAQRLASLWGGDVGDAACVADALARSGLVLPAPVVPANPGRAAPSAVPPAVVIAEADVEAERAALGLARASATPALEIGAGLRHLAGPDDVSLVAGVRVEVPIFDRNTGAIAAAEHRLVAAQARALAVRRESETRTTRLGDALRASATRARTLESTMIPAAERAYAALLKNWQGGAASALEVLDARRTLVELRLQHIDAVSEYHRGLVALEGSLGLIPDRFDSAPTTLVAPPLREKD